MKTKKKVLFIIKDVEVDSFDGDDLPLQELEDFKNKLAFVHHVGIQEIEVVTKDVVVREFSTEVVPTGRALEVRPTPDSNLFPIGGIIFPFNENTPEGVEAMMDMIEFDLYLEVLKFGIDTEA